MNLLFPNGRDCTAKLNADAYRHLAIEEIVGMIAQTTDDMEIVRDVLSCLPQDAKTVRFRQEILNDLMANEQLCRQLNEVIGKLDILKEFKQHNYFTIQKHSNLWELIDYMEEMEVYIEVVESLIQVFRECDVRSQGLTEIASLMQEVVDEDRIGELKEIVGSLRTDVSTLKSITVGINLTPELKPDEVMILGYDTIPFHSKFSKTAWGVSIVAQRRVRYHEPSQFMKYICDDMEKELGKTVQTTKSELKKYINLKGYFLLDICNDLKYYLLVTKFAKKLINDGFSISIPCITEDAKEVGIDGIYNIRLTKKSPGEIVKNDFYFTEKEKLFILTGPNRGGKTMLTQAVGINALFAMQGLLVTADSYKGYLFDNILTHFPADENDTLELGRLGEEAVRVQDIVKAATDRTLVLLNETYSSTSAFDGLYMASDLMHILKHRNVPTIFNTHILELACETDKMNEWEGPSSVVSLTMEIADNVNTFRVLRGEPQRSSYARNIAERYGVTYEQMLGEEIVNV